MLWCYDDLKPNKDPTNYKSLHSDHGETESQDFWCQSFFVVLHSTHWPERFIKHPHNERSIPPCTSECSSWPNAEWCLLPRWICSSPKIELLCASQSQLRSNVVWRRVFWTLFQADCPSKISMQSQDAISGSLWVKTIHNNVNSSPICFFYFWERVTTRVSFNQHPSTNIQVSFFLQNNPIL